MVRSTLLFGNGLGMAVDPQIYALDQALHATWEDNQILDDDARREIRACLPDPVNNMSPDTEDDLDKLQQVLSACDFLSGIVLDEGEHWLSPRGQSFPASIRKFVHRTASRFVNTGCGLPDEFISPLAEYITRSKSHVATLNYDDLLYEGLLSHNVLRGYNGDLLDGITKSGFSSRNLDRRNTNRFGWYLHLHGSPLYYDAENGQVKKLTCAEFSRDAEVSSTHIVLTHVRHKPSIISSSEILTEYWKRLKKAFEESDHIILFGYSGCDTHLNSLIRQESINKKILVVEWSGAGSYDARSEFWRNSLHADAELAPLDNILEFKEW